jgi:hypothetical protein
LQMTVVVGGGIAVALLFTIWHIRLLDVDIGEQKETHANVTTARTAAKVERSIVF